MCPRHPHPSPNGCVSYPAERLSSAVLSHRRWWPPPPYMAATTSLNTASMSRAFSFVNGRGMSCPQTRHKTRFEKRGHSERKVMCSGESAKILCTSWCSHVRGMRARDNRTALPAESADDHFQRATGICDGVSQPMPAPAARGPSCPQRGSRSIPSGAARCGELRRSSRGRGHHVAERSGSPPAVTPACAHLLRIDCNGDILRLQQRLELSSPSLERAFQGKGKGKGIA